MIWLSLVTIEARANEPARAFVVLRSVIRSRKIHLAFQGLYTDAAEQIVLFLTLLHFISKPWNSEGLHDCF